MESELAPANFLCGDATAQMVTAKTHATSKMSDAVLNSGMLGLGDGDEVGEAVGETVGVGEVIAFDMLITETVPLS